MSHVSTPSCHLPSHPYLRAFCLPTHHLMFIRQRLQLQLCIHAPCQRKRRIQQTAFFRGFCLFLFGREQHLQGLLPKSHGPELTCDHVPHPCITCCARDTVKLNVSSRMCCCPEQNQNSLERIRGIFGIQSGKDIYLNSLLSLIINLSSIWPHLQVVLVFQFLMHAYLYSEYFFS